MTNHPELRRIATENTHGPISPELLKRFDRLVAHAPPTLIKGETCYQDSDFTGPIMATWREATILHLIARHLKPKQALEIGSSVGWTAAHIARALPADAVLTCVDPFLECATGLLPETDGAQLERFTQNMQRAGVADRINLVVGRSPDRLDAVAPSDGWDFVFVDGWHHDGQPMRDIMGVLGHVHDETVIALHDIWAADVTDAGRHLAKVGWYFTGYLTPNWLSVFFKGRSWKDAPKWWDKCAIEINGLWESA